MLLKLGTPTFVAMATVPLTYCGQSKTDVSLAGFLVERRQGSSTGLETSSIGIAAFFEILLPLPNIITTQAQTGHVPPESVTELHQNVGPPVMLRVAATSVALFVAGAVQAQVTDWMMGHQSARSS